MLRIRSFQVRELSSAWDSHIPNSMLYCAVVLVSFLVFFIYFIKVETLAPTFVPTALLPGIPSISDQRIVLWHPIYLELRNHLLDLSVAVKQNTPKLNDFK